MSRIHPTAIVDRSAEIDQDVEVGPYVIIKGRVVIGAGTVVDSHCVIHGHTVIGSACRIGPCAFVGLAPQHRSNAGIDAYRCLHSHRTVPNAIAAIRQSVADLPVRDEIIAFLTAKGRGLQPSVHFMHGAAAMSGGDLCDEAAD
jgi:NDP-sugar pyrophosphorylase family protein